MRILITGKKSYIGNSVKTWLNKKEPTFVVHEISLRNIDLKTISFKNYDAIFHVAGIAHISSNKKMIPIYFKINRDLAIDVAKKAKQEGVKQFIFTSTMAIYGDDRPIGDFTPIDIKKPSPTNAYGQSKLAADEAIQKLHDEHFNVSILRLPMVYGVNSKGNFHKLVAISTKIGLFPKIRNVRSALHINNLSKLVNFIINNKISGVLYPQDAKYFNTNEFIQKYRESLGKKTFFFPLTSFFFILLSIFNKSINKIYGNKYYETKHSILDSYIYQSSSITTFINEIKDISC